MLYGKSIIKDYQPDEYIQNAFARYLGFENWIEFRNSAKLQSLSGPQYVSTGSAFPFLTTPVPVLENEEIEDIEEKPSYRWLVAFFMLIIILVAFFYWKTKGKEETLLVPKLKSKYSAEFLPLKSLLNPDYKTDDLTCSTIA
jgi:hypothetical protein